MNIRRRLDVLKRIAAGAALALGAAIASISIAADTPAKDMVLKGDARCTRCHDEGESYPVLSIGKTKHGTRADSRTPTCTSCHGESERHVNRPPDAKERPKPDRTYGAPPPRRDDLPVDQYFGVFGKRTASPSQDRNAACLTCHQGGKRMHWAGSLHANRDVACSSCHQIHATHDRARDKRTQTELCFTCHKEQRAQISRPSRHPIKEGKVACSDCHNPHGSAGPSNLVRDNVNDTCYTCHMEKRGPFVRTHQPVQENCANCHNPHGTTQPNLLKVRPPFLCQQCHEPTSHRGNIGSLSAAATNANSLARGCVNCHTQIHGTNNPANISNERTFRR